MAEIPLSFPCKISGNTPMKLLLALSLLNLLLLLLLRFPSRVAGISDQDLQNAIAALRSNGYHLFCNAIATSDVWYQILSGNSFTFFSPTDAALYSLDLSSEASDYVQTLRYHVALRYLSIDNLRTIPPGSFLETLLPGHDLLLGVRPTDGVVPSQGTEIVTVDGVGISVPDLYRSSDITIHGLEGILAVAFAGNRNSSGDLEIRSVPSRANWTDGSYFSPMLPKIIMPEPSSMPRNVSSTRARNSSYRSRSKSDVHGSRRKRHRRRSSPRSRFNDNGDKQG